MAWQPGTYLQFGDERGRPARDLLMRVPGDTARLVVDLGCGPGNTTRLLRERYTGARIIGVDSSAAMLDRARADGPQAEWVEADIATWRPDARPDLIYTNAALHWLPDHDRLFPQLLDMLPPEGTLAVQMPDNFREPSHTLIADLCRSAPWADRLAELAPGTRVAEPAAYIDRLAPHAQALDLWTTTYWQTLTGPRPVLDWVRGSTLTPILAALPEADHTPFLDALQSGYDRAYPKRPDGTTLFPFRRLFIIARRRPA